MSTAERPDLEAQAALKIRATSVTAQYALSVEQTAARAVAILHLPVTFPSQRLALDDAVRDFLASPEVLALPEVRP